MQEIPAFLRSPNGDKRSLQPHDRPNSQTSVSTVPRSEPLSVPKKRTKNGSRKTAGNLRPLASVPATGISDAFIVAIARGSCANMEPMGVVDMVVGWGCGE